jgi:dihydroorotate dehydrogenase
VAGLKLSNPIGLAAGFDKQAEAIDGLLSLGFGIVEVGSVTPEPQPGNEKPRYFRLTSDRAAINRYGFNSEGHDVILGRLRERIQKWILSSSFLAKSRLALPDSDSETAHLLREADINAVLALDHVPKSLRPGQLLAVNLGKNKTSPENSVQDYVKGVEKLGQYADMIVVNISSPNTPGLRGLQRKGVLEDLMSQVMDARDRLPIKVPVLVKISPDLDATELNDIADAALSSGIQGLIISNTTTSRPSSLMSKAELTNEKGGLSGAPLKPLALQAVEAIRKRVGDKISIIGCGGIFSGEDALDFAKAGADAIELYTSFGYEGVGHPRRVKDELTALLKAQGKTWKESVGTGLQKGDYKSKLPDGEKETGKVGSLNDRFGAAVAGVKGELEDLRRSVGVASNAIVSSTEKEEKVRNRLLESSSPTARPVFRPDPNDKDYVSLMDKVHKALGADSSSAEIEKEDTMKVEMTKAEALRAKVGIALQDPMVAPSAALEGLGEQATVGGGQAYSGRIQEPSKSLKVVDGRGTATSSGRGSEGRIGMGGKAEYNAADRARVV